MGDSHQDMLIGQEDLDCKPQVQKQSFAGGNSLSRGGTPGATNFLDDMKKYLTSKGIESTEETDRYG